MPVGWSPAVSDAIIAAARGGAAFQLPAAHHIQLHSGEPGPNGTANVLNAGVRQPTGYVSANSGANIANNQALTWANWQGSTNPTHFSDWSAATGGSFQFSGTVSMAGTIAPGATVTIAAGALIVDELAAS